MTGLPGGAAGIQQIATATGLSKSTVSRALRGMPSVADTTVDQVRRVADELGYVPSSAAAGLATGRQRAVGVVLPVIDRWFFVKALGGVDAELKRAGYDLVLYNLGGPGGDRDRAFRRSMLRHRVDGLVLMSLVLDATERAELELARHPMIVIGGLAPGLRNVGVDDRAVTRTAVGHLCALGHRAVAYVGGQDEAGMNVAVPHLRRDGFVDAMRAAGRVVPAHRLLDGGFSFPGGVAAGSALLDAPERPTAVLCASDEMALGVLLAAHRAGLSVPEDLSVMGIDGHEYGRTVGLTTVAQDPEAQGRTAARAVLAEVEGAATRSIAAAPAALVVRATTGRVPGG
ncbi:LacI family DNA-binding transcriptional regulator [Curtobacterium sp. MCLR17_036]|uniref:LacI family DNA-binding transcriptional regulator n=1 Tax=Curtobacterium sp. MCLR17_036 TaxID=2175620 RepID=UPI0021ACB8F3|nr:LacI family DNA-binding transcriptional regulator [Curtobacterium sp. MCLR17_036]WIE63732.1 LacI family DNA-binding transcriptional regulator [Curtobacterium sp. MCLR17_036]